MPWYLIIIDVEGPHYHIVGHEDVLRHEFQKWRDWYESLDPDDPSPVNYMVHVIGWMDYPYRHARELMLESGRVAGMMLEQVRLPAKNKAAPEPAPTTN